MTTTLDPNALSETLKGNPRLLNFFIDDVIKMIETLPEEQKSNESALTSGYWERHQHPKK